MRQRALMLVMGLGLGAVAAVVMLGPGADDDGDVGATVRLARYPGGAAAAVSFTFDDGVLDQFTLALPLLAELNLSATFFINTGAVSEADAAEPRTLNWEQWRQVAAAGHEIANHTVSHRDLRGLDEPTLRAEVLEAKSELASRLGVTVESFAFPFDASDRRARAFVAEHHAAVRGPAVFHGVNGFDAEQANARLDEAVRRGDWHVAVFHAVETGYAPVGHEALRLHLQHAAALRDRGRLHIDTFARLSRYQRQHDAATLTVLEYDPSQRRCTFVLTTSLPEPITDTPLTVVIRTDAEPHLVTAMPDGREVTVTW